MPSDPRERVAAVAACSLGLALVDGVLVAATSTAESPVAVGALAVATQSLLGVSAVLAVSLGAALRGSRSTRFATRGLAALATSALLLRTDLTPWATRTADGASPLPRLLLGISVAAGAWCLAGAAGRALARRGRGVFGVAVAIGTLIANHGFLQHDYRGVHLHASILALLLAFESVAPSFQVADRKRSLVASGIAMISFAVAGLAEPPSTGTWIELLRNDGASVAPYVAELRASLERRSRRALPPIAIGPDRAPTQPGLGVPEPLVVLLTIDCMRADVLRTHRARLPHLAALADRSVRFRSAHTAAPATMVSITSIFEGRLYTQQRWTPRVIAGAAMPEPSATRLPTLLTARGVDTVLLESSDWMRPSLGVTSGFARSIALPREVRGIHAHASTVARALLSDLDALRGPRFVYAHFLEPHAPYDLGASTGSDRERYVAELALVDAAIGSIVEGIERLGLGPRTILIVAADHGEAFFEHGNGFHGTTLYEEITHVPLFVRLPTRTTRDVDAPVGTLDLAPTILDVYGLPTPGVFLGESLVPALLGRGLPSSRIVAADSGRLARAMWFPDGFKVILDLRTGASELYDLRQDPRERRNLYATGPAVRTHRDRMLDWFDRHAPAAPGYSPPYRLP